MNPESSVPVSDSAETTSAAPSMRPYAVRLGAAAVLTCSTTLAVPHVASPVHALEPPTYAVLDTEFGVTGASRLFDALEANASVADLPRVVSATRRGAQGSEKVDPAPAAFLSVEGEVLWRRAVEQLAAEPVEAGVHHPAEDTLRDLIGRHTAPALNRILEVTKDASRSGLAADILLLLSQVNAPGDTGWQKALIGAALELPVAQLRDAALQCAEYWENPGLAEVLAQHPLTPDWLDAYRRQILDDLRG